MQLKLDDNILYELNLMPEDTTTESFLEYANRILDLDSLTEAEYRETSRQLTFDVMDIDKFIKVNECREITNPNFFIREGIPTPDGLLSNEIFGITQEDRAGIFAYISLNGTFIDPLSYKLWRTVDSKIKAVIQGTARFIINDKGELEESEDGENGIEFLKNNFTKLKIKGTESRKRDMKIKFIERNFKSGRLFIDKYIIIPAYYRDVNTTGAHVGVGEINRLYANILRFSNSLKETQDYGLPRNDVIAAQIQETLVTIYDWFCGNTNSSIKEEGSGMSGKFGILRRANLSKTSDYSSRLVISASELKCEKIDNLMVNLDKSAIPLAAVAADFYPYMMFHIRRFFENEFVGIDTYTAVDENGNEFHLKIKDPMLTFSDDLIKKELKRYLRSYSDRFKPIIIPIEEESSKLIGGKKVCMRFKGRGPDDKYDRNTESIYNRPLTWTDVIYMAAVEATKDKKIMITRYPIDSFYNMVITNIEVSSTNETEPMYIENTFYPFYPKTRREDINNDTSNKFIDTLQLSNLYLAGLGGDYDGDQVSAKGSFFKETNEELDAFMKSKINFIGLGGINKRTSSNESVQAMYNLTKILDQDKNIITDPVF